nr:ATP synthase F0 subunit 8 [Incisitermes minor]
MPQMMPMSWSILFTMFSMTLIALAAMNYYTSVQKASNATTSTTLIKKNMNWKW